MKTRFVNCGNSNIFIKKNKMISSKQNFSNADFYFGFLKTLDLDSKLDLISKLSLSLKDVENVLNKSLQSLFGAYKSEDSAEEIIAELKASRVFTC